MAQIVEFAPVYSEADNSDYHFVNGTWNAHDQAESLAVSRGHSYLSPGDFVTLAAADTLLASADALVLAPSVAGPSGMWQPTDGEEAGRILGHRILDRIGADKPDLHIVLISHFLVGHGAAHRNAKPNTRALRALEAHLRGGRNPYTILRPTWLSTIHDESYQTRLSQDPYADGLVSRDSIAAAVLTAVENPRVATGRTAALFNLSIPGAGSTDLADRFGSLALDYEAEFALQTA